MGEVVDEIVATSRRQADPPEVIGGVGVVSMGDLDLPHQRQVLRRNCARRLEVVLGDRITADDTDPQQLAEGVYGAILPHPQETLGRPCG
jgi:hypothetical protein